MSWKPSYVISEWAWVWQNSWCHISKCLKPLSVSLKLTTTLVATTCSTMERRKSCKTTYLHDEGKGSEKRPLIFIFRLNIVLHDSYQADEIVMEIKELKQKFPDGFVKSFSRVLLSVLKASIVSQRNCMVWIVLVWQQLDYS